MDAQSARDIARLIEDDPDAKLIAERVADAVGLGRRRRKRGGNLLGGAKAV